MSTNRYDIRIQQETPTELHVWINDKLREYETLHGVLRTDVPAVLANSFLNELTDALRHNPIPHDQIPGLVRTWLNNLEEKYLKDFTDGQNQ